MDLDFCMQREEAKSVMFSKMDPKEVNVGLASHWTNFQRRKDSGELCRFANGCFLGDVLNNETTIYDNRGEIPFSQLESHWSLVEL